MPTFPNLPVIGASQVTNSGTTSNDADAAIINGLANPRAETVDNTNAFAITNAAADYLWERNISWRFTDDASAPTAQITLTVPTTPARGLFGVINATGQDMQVETSAQVLTAPVIAAGDAALLSNDGTNVELLSSGAGVATFLGLTDTPASFTAGKFLKVNAGGTALIETDEPAGAGDALPYTLSPAWRGARISKTTAQASIGTGGVEVTFDESVIDTDGIADLANQALKVPAGVTKVRLRAMIMVDNADVDGFMFGEIVLNDASMTGISARPLTRFERATAAGDSELQLVSPVIDVVANDSFTLNVQVGADATADVAAETWFELEIVETTDTVPSLRTVVASLPARYRGSLANRVADQTAADYSTAAAIPFNAEIIDTDAIHDTATNNSRLTVPAGVSKVRIKGNIRTSMGTTGEWVRAEIRKAGAAFDGMATDRVEVTDATADLNLESADIVVSQGDYFELFLETETDASITVERENTWLQMEIVEFNSSTDAVQAYIAVPPEHKGVRLERTSAQSIPVGTDTDIAWQAASEDTTFDPGDDGPAQRFWFGANWTFVDGDVSVANDEITETAHGYQTGEGPVRLTNSGGALPTGLAVDTDYWIIRVDANTLKFATSRANALAGTDVDITAAAGGGTHTVDQEDYIVIPAGIAKAKFFAGISWAANASGLRALKLERRNAADVLQAFDGRPIDFGAPAPSSITAKTIASSPIAVSEGERYAIEVHQTTAGSLNVDNADQTYFALEVVEESRAITYPGVTVTPPARHARISKSASQTSLGTGIVEATFDETEVDTYSLADLANNALKVPAGVTKVRLKAMLIVNNADVDGFLFGEIKLNDATLDSIKARTLTRFERATAAGDAELILSTPIIDVVVDDSFTLDIQVGADTTADMLTGTWFEMEVVETEENAFPPEPVEFFVSDALFDGALPTTGLIYKKTAARRFTLSDDFAGSVGHSEVAATGATIFDVNRNGAKIGEINVANTAQAATFTTTAAAVEVFDVGDRLDVAAPSAWNSIDEFAVSFWAWRS